MKLNEIKDMLACELLTSGKCPEREVVACMSCDMMSDVLAYAKPGALLITGLTNSQSVRTAEVADLAGIIYVRGKRPDQQTISLADELGVPLLSTSLTMFETSWKLHSAGLEGIC